MFAEPCVEIKNGCNLKRLSADFINVQNCRSIDKIDREECVGICLSKQSNRLVMNNNVIEGSSECKCCKAAQTYAQQVAMECLTDSVNNVWTPKNATLIRINSCDCKSCRKNEDE